MLNVYLLTPDQATEVNGPFPDAPLLWVTCVALTNGLSYVPVEIATAPGLSREAAALLSSLTPVDFATQAKPFPPADT
jgi:hypothetical protein